MGTYRVYFVRSTRYWVDVEADGPERAVQLGIKAADACDGEEVVVGDDTVKALADQMIDQFDNACLEFHHMTLIKSE